MPTTKRVRRHARQANELSPVEMLNLICGRGFGRAFTSEEQRREAWFGHREEVIQNCNPGFVPAAQTDYETTAGIWRRSLRAKRNDQQGR